VSLWAQQGLVKRKLQSSAKNRAGAPWGLFPSGKFNVRVPKSLHPALATEAEAKGVRLIQLVVAKLALHLLVR